MFDTLPETRKVSVQGRTNAMILAFSLHGLGFLGLGIANAIAVSPLEPPKINVVFLSAAAPPPPPPPPAARKPKPKTPEPEAKPRPEPQQQAPEIVQPMVVPDKELEKLEDTGAAEDDGGFDTGTEGGVEGGIEGGVAGGTVGGVEGGVVDPDEPLRVGGDVEPPQITKQVKPRYPEIAKAAKIQGVVILETIINTEGRIEDVRVLRGHPLLEEAAKEAIVKWQFTPGRLNGKPVKVYFTLTVNFTLK